MGQDPAAGVPTPFQRRLPNALTMLRVVLAVAFFAILTPWEYQDSPLAHGRSPDWWLLVAAAVFVVAALTDLLDGMLARRWKVISVFGRVMDPFADKLLVIGAFVYLAGPGFTNPRLAFPELVGPPAGDHLMGLRGAGPPVAPWMVAVILGRELLVTSIRGVIEATGMSFAATRSGKWKMVLQSVCVPAVLVLLNVPVRNDPDALDWAGWLMDGLVWATVIVTVWSGIPYGVRAIREASRAKEQR